ncbi:MAG: hypothetical protein ACRD4E_11930, partial [Bryobacteraceae bacterium]
DSMVTVPVLDTTGSTVSSPVTVIGFLQLFLQPTGRAVPGTGMRTKIINLVGCGVNATGPPIYGNGATAVPVRLITPP